MQKKISCRKSVELGEKLREMYPGSYKVCCNYGYGDGCTVGECLDICSALVLLAKNRSHGNHELSLSDLFSGSSSSSINYTMHHAFDQTNVDYIAKQGDEMVWEAADFDPYST